MSDLSGYIPSLGRGVTIGNADMGTAAIASVNIDPKFGQFISVPITSAQILALGGATVSLIPSPGAGNAIIVTDAVLDIGTGTAYAAGGTVGLYYGGTSVLIAGAVSSQFTATLGSTVYLSPNAPLAIITGTSVVLGQVSSTAFTTGNETASVNIWYATLPTGH